MMACYTITSSYNYSKEYPTNNFGHGLCSEAIKEIEHKVQLKHISEAQMLTSDLGLNWSCFWASEQWDNKKIIVKYNKAKINSLGIVFAIELYERNSSTLHLKKQHIFEYYFSLIFFSKREWVSAIF